MNSGFETLNSLFSFINTSDPVDIFSDNFLPSSINCKHMFQVGPGNSIPSLTNPSEDKITERIMPGLVSCLRMLRILPGTSGNPKALKALRATFS